MGTALGKVIPMRRRRGLRSLRSFNRLDQRDKILLGLSAVMVVGGVYLAKFAPDPETLHGLYGLGEVQSGGTVISLRRPLMSNLWRQWRNMLTQTGPYVR
jgi:hypothetical protein